MQNFKDETIVPIIKIFYRRGKSYAINFVSDFRHETMSTNCCFKNI